MLRWKLVVGAGCGLQAYGINMELSSPAVEPMIRHDERADAQRIADLSEIQGVNDFPTKIFFPEDGRDIASMSVACHEKIATKRERNQQQFNGLLELALDVRIVVESFLEQKNSIVTIPAGGNYVFVFKDSRRIERMGRVSGFPNDRLDLYVSETVDITLPETSWAPCILFDEQSEHTIPVKDILYAKAIKRKGPRYANSTSLLCHASTCNQFCVDSVPEPFVPCCLPCILTTFCVCLPFVGTQTCICGSETNNNPNNIFCSWPCEPTCFNMQCPCPYPNNNSRCAQFEYHKPIIVSPCVCWYEARV